MALSRRELLTLLLGAPLAAAACRRRPFRTVPGEIRGGAVDVGHRLRDATVERASGEPRRAEIAIIGAGASGLSAAWRFDALGERRYVVFELESQPGGTSAFGTDGAVAYPWGAHYVPAPTSEQRALVALFDEMGVFDSKAKTAREPREELRIREPEERIFLEGRWHEGLFPFAGASEMDRAELARFTRVVDGWVKWRDAKGRRAFTIPSSGCSDDAEVTALDRLSAGAWLAQNGFRSPRLRWYVEYATRDDYGLALEHTSAWAMLFYFASRQAEPGADSAPFVAWPEGNGRIVRHLAGRVGDRLNTRCLVTDVVPREDRVELSVLDAATGKLALWHVDRLVMAVPKMIARRIVRPWRDAPPPFLADFTYGSWVVANLHVRNRPRAPGYPMAWDNVLYDSPSLGYVNAAHQALSDVGPTVLTYYLPLTDEDPDAARRRLLAGDHQGMCDAVLSDLGRAHDDLERLVDRIDVWRWGHAMIRPTPGFVWGPSRRRAAQALGRVHFAHSDLSGVALFEEAQDHGVRAAEAVLRARGRETPSLAG